MNAKSLLNLGLLDWIVSIFDNIPRAIYFFFAAFTSGIDALQNLMRKLAGLDVYYTKVISDNSTIGIGGGDSFWTSTIGVNRGLSARWGQDPLTEFIYGTLGIGDTASAYRSLTTVFWSLSIFAIIILVLSTMVAMIKSHYSEDYQNTNPWKYIYTAIKAILTYAVMPLVVVIGMQISHFILQTLDNITAGTDASKVEGMFGTAVARNNFELSTYAEGTSSEKKTYTHYDFFGGGNPTTTSTFGGMLFTAAGYTSNRARSGTITLAQLEKTGVFANSSCPDYAKLTDPEAKLNYAADQIDFAFANHIRWNKTKNIITVQSWFPNVRYAHSTDFFGIKAMVGFSKYNVTAVWLFYDLWQFQFIVAFGGGVTAVGILLSVILGLMSRLIKGAALFLIYPPLIGLAPLDNFKAFKSWGTQFMQQILMAYGAVIGMNILMLVLPLVQNISWYGPGLGVLDAIVNMIILIVGLLMMKDFIAIVSGFVGGADANSIGQGLKTDVQGAVKKGFSATAKLGGGAIKAGIAGVRLGGAAVKKVRNRGDRAALDNLDANKKVLAEQDSGFANGLVLDKKVDQLSLAAKTGKTDGLDEQEKATVEYANKARKAAIEGGKTETEADAIARQAVERHMKADNSYDKLSKQQKENISAFKERHTLYDKDGNSLGLDSHAEGVLETYKDIKRANNLTDRVASGDIARGASGQFVKTETDKKLEKTEKKLSKLEKQDAGQSMGGILKQKLGLDFNAKDAGKQMGDSFLKAMGSMGEAFGLDKVISGMKDPLGQGLTLKGGAFEDKKAEGDNLHRETAATAKANAENQLKAQQKTNELLNQLILSNQDIKKASEANTAAIGKLTTPKPDKKEGK